ncbi:hypothetical protein COCNU_scaffold004789G000010 [Cocos nucifera]|nr:hypothetical protein [Cocos nucifera]
MESISWVQNNTKGLILAMVSSAFIDDSFILKKKGLKRASRFGIPAGHDGIEMPFSFHSHPSVGYTELSI